MQPDAVHQRFVTHLSPIALGYSVARLYANTLVLRWLPKEVPPYVLLPIAIVVLLAYLRNRRQAGADTMKIGLVGMVTLLLAGLVMLLPDGVRVLFARIAGARVLLYPSLGVSVIAVALAVVYRKQLTLKIRALLQWWRCSKDYTLYFGLLGTITIVAGFAMFLPSGQRMASWRVFLYPSIGASVVLAVLAIRYGKKFALVLLALLVGLGLAASLQQHEKYVSLSEDQQQVILAAVSALAEQPGKETVILIDQTGKVTPFLFANSRRVRIALQVIFDNPDLMFMVCHESGNQITMFYEACEIRENSIILRYSEIPYSTGPDTVSIVPRQGAIVLEWPQGPGISAPIPKRAYQLLSILH